MKSPVRLCFAVVGVWTFFWALIHVPSLHAQGVTTSALSGTVSDGTEYLRQLDEALAGKISMEEVKNRFVSGAKVSALHLPSGTTYNAVVRSDGFYNLRGLRVGGPYKITVTAVGYKKEESKDLFLTLGENRRLDFALTAAETTLGEVTVTSNRNTRSESRIGAGADISTAQLESLPTIARALQDMARTNPLVVGNNLGAGDNVGGISIAGQNNRFNNLQVDGAVGNDVFGLNTTGAPGGQANAQPISLDAIAEVQVAVASYDIRQSGFTGGLVNTVTRSGTNKLEGSAYFYGKNQALVGRSPDELRTPFPTFADNLFGARLGGAIIENTLFFFLSAEAKFLTSPLELGINDPRAANNFPVPADSLRRIIDIARRQYNYDAGTFDTFTRTQNDVKLFGRIDWNISENHKLTLRSNYVNATQDRGVDRNPFSLSFSSMRYTFGSAQNTTVLQLNSNFENFANELRVSYALVREARQNFQGGNYPYVQIGVAPNRNVAMGVEQFSQANSLDQDLIEITNDFTLFAGAHTITIGTHNEIFTSRNVFFPWYFGAYLFGSIQDYANGTPFGFINRFSTDKTRFGNTPTAVFNSVQLGFYAQDEWDILANLRLNLGIRGEFFLLPTAPYDNPLVAQAFPGFRTDAVPSNSVLLSPRVGVRWDASGDKGSTIVRAGTGLFTGRSPIVWLSNQFSNTGVDVATNFLFGPSAPNRMTAGNRFLNPNNPPAQPAQALQPGQYQATVNIIDPNFRLPQVWRSNIGIDQRLPAGFGATLEALYSANINYPLYRNLRLGQSTPNRIDGRPMYRYNGGENNTPLARTLDYAFFLTNINAGYSFNVMAQIGKVAGAAGDEPENVSDFVKNLGVNLAYTYGESWDVNSNPGYIADENYLVPAADPNNLPLTRSVFDIPHRLVLTLGYRFEYGAPLFSGDASGGKWATTISLFYEGRSGRPFSYVYGGADDVNGDRMTIYPTNNDLIFVPANRNQVSMSDAEWRALDSYIAANPELNSYRGQIMPRNAAREPWVNQVDMNILQDIPTFNGQRLQLSLAVLNVLNLLNPDWGHQQFVQNPLGDFSGQTRFLLMQHNGYEADGRPKLNFTAPATVFTKDNLLSRWQMQFGVRYIF
jgi:hypothetical protein